MKSIFTHSSSDNKAKVAKSEEVAADSSQQVTSAALTGAEVYDTSYSTAAAAYSASLSAYSYAAPSQSQWAAYSAYSAAHPVRSLFLWCYTVAHSMLAFNNYCKHYHYGSLGSIWDSWCSPSHAATSKIYFSNITYYMELLKVQLVKGKKHICFTNLWSF